MKLDSLARSTKLAGVLLFIAALVWGAAHLATGHGPGRASTAQLLAPLDPEGGHALTDVPHEQYGRLIRIPPDRRTPEQQRFIDVYEGAYKYLREAPDADAAAKRELRKYENEEARLEETTAPSRARASAARPRP